MHEGDPELVLPGRCVEANLPQPVVDFFDRGIERLIDRLVFGFAADCRAVELLAVEQRDHGVLELHPRHFARQRHVADRELVLTVRREIVFDDEAAARAEWHPFDVMLLPAGAGSAGGRQRDHHVGDVAVGRRLGQGLGVSDRLERDCARRVDVLVDEVGRDLQRGGVVVEVPLDVVVGQPRLGVDVEPEQIADGVAVLATVETTQRHASRCAVGRRGVDLVLEPRHELGGHLAIGALGPSRRHQATAQLANHLLGDFGALVDVVQVQLRQRHAARLEPVVVAGDTVLIDQRALRRDRSRGTGRGCGGDLRAGGRRTRCRGLRLCPQAVCDHEAEQHGTRGDCIPGNSSRHSHPIRPNPLESTRGPAAIQD